MRRIIWALLLVIAGCAPQVANRVVGGPFVVNVTSRSATIGWLVQSGGVQLRADSGQMQTSPALHGEHVTFSDLRPGTAYHYEIPGTEDSNGEFKTPPVGPANFDFVVFGDTRTRHEIHRRIVEAIVKVHPDFVVHTGDLVANGADTALWPIFFSIEHELLRNTVFCPVLGNHERNNQQFYDFFDVQSPYYSFDWGSVHFTILNSDLGNVAPSGAARDTFWTEQTRWLESDLAKNQKAAFRFVAFHHPPFTAVSRRQADVKPVTAWVPLFEKYKVTAVFNGHDHNYQHHLVHGIHYVVTGGGGAPLYPADAPIPGVTVKVEKIENYVTVRVTGDHAKVRAIALDGHLIDSFDLP